MRMEDQFCSDKNIILFATIKQPINETRRFYRLVGAVHGKNKKKGGIQFFGSGQ
jgi:hypothetical protein